MRRTRRLIPCLFQRIQYHVADRRDVVPHLSQIANDKRACVYEYRVNSRVAGDTEAIVSCHVDEWSAMRLVATVMKSIALVQSGLISVLLEPKAPPKRLFSFLLPPFAAATNR